MAGLYVHIPFCKSRCIYCGFFSTTSSEMSSRYVDCLCSELSMRGHDYARPWTTVYLGGGTPSTLPAPELRRLFGHIDCSHAVEVTIECNPDDVDADFGSLLATLPVNRVSMGVQSFDDRRLSFLRRRHSASDVLRAVNVLRSAGIDNISIDLIYGFPGETLDDWDNDITAALALNVEHISAYCLTYEEDTPLYRMLHNGTVKETDEETCRTMYYHLRSRLLAAGYEHYELSNFALPGRRAVHNSNYWNLTPYLGIGASAHSYDGMVRCWNVASLPLYINKVEKGDLPIDDYEGLTLKEQYNDMVMVRLRTSEGISLSEVSNRFGYSVLTHLLSQAKPYMDLELLELTTDNGNPPNRHLRLSEDALYVCDMITADLFRL